MKTKNQEKAEMLRRQLGNLCPAALRAPLRAVQDGTELPGTARDILDMAEFCLKKRGATK